LTPDSSDIISLFQRLKSLSNGEAFWPPVGIVGSMVAAIVAQNSLPAQVFPVMERLQNRGWLEPRTLHQVSQGRLKEQLQGVSCTNQKSSRIKRLMEFLLEERLALYSLLSQPVERIRQQLLAIRGIGEETADTILLFAFDKPVFIVDSYSRRFFARFQFPWMQKASYTEVRGFFQANFPPDPAAIRKLHALVHHQARNVCKPRPQCSACAFRLSCVHALGQMNVEEKTCI